MGVSTDDVGFDEFFGEVGGEWVDDGLGRWMSGGMADEDVETACEATGGERRFVPFGWRIFLVFGVDDVARRCSIEGKEFFRSNSL